MRRSVIAVLAALTLPGCYTMGTRVSETDLNQFRKGVTTEPEVVKGLGSPQSIATSIDGTQVLTYSWAHARVKGTTFIPIVQLFASGAKVEGKAITFVFGPDGTLSNITSVESNTDSRSYVGGASVRTESSSTIK